MRVAAIILALVFAAGANALSCLPPDFARSYQAIAEAPERYTMVVGKISFDKRKLPKVDFNRQEETPPLTEIPGRFEGRSLQQDGFTGTWQRDITLRVLCLGPWCSGGPGDQEVLAFVNLDHPTPSVEVGPCGGNVFPADQQTLDKALSCYRGKNCAPAPFPGRN